MYDTYEHCITVLNLRDMMKLESYPIIQSGGITDMFIDYHKNMLYYQKGGYHDTLNVEF